MARIAISATAAAIRKRRRALPDRTGLFIHRIGRTPCHGGEGRSGRKGQKKRDAPWVRRVINCEDLTELVGEDPASSEISGSADRDDGDHAGRGGGVAGQFENSTHCFLLDQLEARVQFKDRAVSFFLRRAARKDIDISKSGMTGYIRGSPVDFLPRPHSQCLNMSARFTGSTRFLRHKRIKTRWVSIPGSGIYWVLDDLTLVKTRPARIIWRRMVFSRDCANYNLGTSSLSIFSEQSWLLRP